MSTPLCPIFGKCGGCTSQHIAYELQLENKRKKMAASCRISTEQVLVFSGEPYSYRNRMDFIFHKNGLGLRERDKWQRVVDVASCPIAEPKINELLSELRSFFKETDYFDMKAKAGTFRYAVVRIGKSKTAISFVLNEDSSRLAAAVELVRSFAENSSADNILVTYVPSNADVSISSEFFTVKGYGTLEAELLGKKFNYSVQGFFQNNHAMAEKMHEYVHGLLRKHDTGQCHLLDLYAGVGTFGIINSGLFKGVTVVEEVTPCIEAANANILANGVKNARAVLLDARKISRLGLPKELFVITDPPRSGMHPDTIRNMIERKPKVIIYVSCNLEQLYKDLPKFQGYDLKSAAVFDLFPQTPHCEGVVELVRVD